MKIKNIFGFIVIILLIGILLGEIIYIYKTIIEEKNIVSGYYCPVCGEQNVLGTYPLEECKLEMTIRKHLVCANCETRFYIEKLK